MAVATQQPGWANKAATRMARHFKFFKKAWRTEPNGTKPPKDDDDEEASEEPPKKGGFKPSARGKARLVGFAAGFGSLGLL